jgi:glucose-specific phosphotransferase system IIA component
MIIYSPVKGEQISLERVSDPVFSQKMMGDGTAIIPSEKTIVAPISGVLTTVFPTKHAFGIEGDNGEEILIHIGINTVELNGKYFTLHVKQDDYVKQGDPLVTVDFDSIKKEGYSLETPLIVLNTSNYKEIRELEQGPVDQLQPILELVE